MLSWVLVTMCHTGFIYKAEKLFPLLNSLTLITAGPCPDALSLVTFERWWDRVALSCLLLADSTSCNILPRKCLPWRCRHWLGGGWALAPRKSPPLTHQASLAWGDLLRMWPFSPLEGRTRGLARCWPTVTAKASLWCADFARHFTCFFFPLNLHRVRWGLIPLCW